MDHNRENNLLKQQPAETLSSPHREKKPFSIPISTISMRAIGLLFAAGYRPVNDSSAMEESASRVVSIVFFRGQ